MLDLFQNCIWFLGIKAPVRFEFRERVWRNNSGVHWAAIRDNGEIKEHIIKISSKFAYTPDQRSFDSVLAHEFVHAWQAEYKRWIKKSHNKSFQNKAAELQEFLNNEGFNISDIYIKGHDTS